MVSDVYVMEEYDTTSTIEPAPIGMELNQKYIDPANSGERGSFSSDDVE